MPKTTKNYDDMTPDEQNEYRFKKLEPVASTYFAVVDDIAAPGGTYEEYDPEDLQLLGEARSRLVYAMTTKDADILQAEMTRMSKDMDAWHETGAWPKRAIVIKPSGPPRPETPPEIAEPPDRADEPVSFWSQTPTKIAIGIGFTLLVRQVMK